MIRTLHNYLLLNLLSALLGITALGAEKPASIPAGTTLRVRLGTTLTDKTNQTGDLFTGTVTKAILINDTEIVPEYSTVSGHVAFVKPSGRIRGKAQMRIVIDSLTTPEEVVYPFSGTLEQAEGGVCGDSPVSGKIGEEGTITGCGKSKKKAALAAAMGGGIGAAAGGAVGAAGRGGCDAYGNCWPSSGPSMGTGIGYGAAIGAGTALIYHFLKHEKHIVLVQGTELTFAVSRAMTAAAPAIDQPPSR